MGLIEFFVEIFLNLKKIKYQVHVVRQTSIWILFLQQILIAQVDLQKHKIHKRI